MVIINAWETVKCLLTHIHDVITAKIDLLYSTAASIIFFSFFISFAGTVVHGG